MYSKQEQLKKNKKKKVSTFGKKKSCLKNTALKKKSKKPKIKYDINLLDTSVTVRFSPKEIRKRVEWIKDTFGFCQICGTKQNLDYPHHALDGISRKDDRTMIDICVSCHSHIHTKGFDGLAKTREQVEAIGWENNKKYLRNTDASL